MATTNYGVFKGRALDRKLGAGSSPHYHIHGLDDGAHFRVSVNFKSKFHPSELLYFVDEDFRHPITDGLRDLALGFTPVRKRMGGLALDYIRGNLFDPAAMKPLPHKAPGPDDDLNDKFDAIIQRAIADERVLLYAFGTRWGPVYRKKDRYFRFTPRNGIHDIHMNQGSHPLFQAKDGVWQDGGLLVQFPRTGRRHRWVAVFLKFQSQAWHTDDETGHAIEPSLAGTGTEEGGVRIVAALIHPESSRLQDKTVTLWNGTPVPIDLTNWALCDRRKNIQRLGGRIQSGGTLVIPVAENLRLPSRGGIITLLNRWGIKIDGVSYTKSQGRRRGTTIVFPHNRPLAAQMPTGGALR